MEYSNNIRKLVVSLRDAKHRKKNNLFVVEGAKSVADTLGKFRCRYLLASDKWFRNNTDIKVETIVVNNRELERLSSLMSAPDVIAVYELPSDEIFDTSLLNTELVLALDTIQDPGNFGTIIRLADWFGIKHIICSNDTVDLFNSKVIQSTMGAICNVKVYYQDLHSLIKNAARIPIYGTFLDGENIYKATLSKNGIIVMGNEGKGISPAIANLITNRLLIPNYERTDSVKSSDSLNVATATAITLSEFRRR